MGIGMFVDLWNAWTYCCQELQVQHQEGCINCFGLGVTFVCIALHHVGAGLVLDLLLLIGVGTSVKPYVQHVLPPEHLLVWLYISAD